MIGLVSVDNSLFGCFIVGRSDLREESSGFILVASLDKQIEVALESVDAGFGRAVVRGTTGRASDSFFS